MRLRNIPGSREEIAQSQYVVHEDVMKEKRGLWKEVFGNDHPLYIEVGMGKGKFIAEMARIHPEYNFVGIEKYSSVRCEEKRGAAGAGKSSVSADGRGGTSGSVRYGGSVRYLSEFFGSVAEGPSCKAPPSEQRISCEV